MTAERPTHMVHVDPRTEVEVRAAILSALRTERYVVLACDPIGDATDAFGPFPEEQVLSIAGDIRDAYELEDAPPVTIRIVPWLQWET